MKKNRTKSILACAVLASVMAGGFGLGVGRAEAADFTYSIDDATPVVWDGTSDLIGTGTTLEVWGETGATSNNFIYGGFDGGSVTIGGKTVIFNSGTVTDVYGGYSDSGTASGNIVDIEGGTADNVYGGYSYFNTVSGNTVNIKGGHILHYVYGGNSAGGNVTGNTVNVEGGEISIVRGGNSAGGVVTDNTVNIKNGTIYNVIGGNGKTVTGNTVNITGGMVGAVYGGRGQDVSNNTVKISGNNDLELSNAVVCGWEDIPSRTTHSGNTLQIERDVTIKEIGNFDKINFVLPTVTADTTLLSLTNEFSATNEDATNVDVGVYLGENTTGTLNEKNVTLADKFIGNFEVTYYDKNNNPGYVEEFNLASAGALIICNGTRMRVGYDLTTNANEFLGRQDTIYIDAGKTLTLDGGTLTKKLTDAGNIIIDGDVTTNADNIATTGINTVASGKTLTFTAGTLAQKVQGEGNLTFNCDMTINADNIATTGTNTVNAGKTLTLDGGTLNNDIYGDDATVKLYYVVNVYTDQEIKGTLDGNGHILNMTENRADSKINTLTVGTLKGKTHLQLDVDLNKLQGDKIAATTVDSGAWVNVRGINVTADATEPLEGKLISYVTEGGSQPVHGTYTVNSTAEGGVAGSLQTITNLHTYRFYSGGNGVLLYDVVGGGIGKITFKNFIEGVGTVADTFSLTADYNYTDTGTANMEAARQNHNILNINLNGHNLNKTTDVMTVDVGAKTLNLDGGAEGSTDLNFEVDNGGKLNISGKTDLKGNVTNAGDVTFMGETKAEGILSGAGSYTNSGSMTVADAGKLQMSSAFNNNGNLEIGGGTLRQNITGSGTAEFNGTVGVADGVNLGTVGNDVNGTLDVAGHITTDIISFKKGSTLKVDGSQIMGTAAINVGASATVEEGAKLYVSNAIKDAPYKILAGNGIKVNSWQTDADMADGFKAAYGLKLDTGSIINDGYEFTIRFVKDDVAMDNLDISNVYENAALDSALFKSVDLISMMHSDIATQATIINTMANANALANVQQGMQMVSNATADAIQSNIGAGARPMLEQTAEGVGHKDGMRNVSADAKDSAAIEVVETGKADEVMPSAVVTEEQKYDKEVWANFIHSKKTIDGLKTGSLEQDSTIQFNGVTVGVDLWSNAKGFGGFAFTTAEGKIHSYQDAASVKNDTDYHGVSLYQRYDYKGLALLMDLTYTHAKNDVTMSTAVGVDVTAKPKADAYSAGLMIEKPVKLGHSTQLTPYTGARYTHIHTDDYENSLGINNDIKDQDIVSVPVGLQLKSEMETERGWKFGHILEGGYVWNFGDRQSEQRLGYQGVYDSIDFDVTGRGEYFLKTALTASHKDTDFELGYRFTRGDNEKDNKWNFNVNYNFGNSKGLPYKSVLLGKIDLLESANKALRAENVDLKAENVQLKVENAAIKEQIAQLVAMIEELKNK